ncbi:MAG: S23 ribosomal protein [Candidatus Curtissbacteria bacterium GW2011_GWA1_41_11]|uniref:S23 ribosomal protein n=1 Tax=Candidatus Curtissbacteria bacterium GW2011_GWA1_41_11 TaxID=1618409 RepID=A0A0G0UGC6_9BACT|nr:MAG: S23 ribosomal protein [Candidatus Curtissbacteria bacterium GW2011_GWA1_41_11]
MPNARYYRFEKLDVWKDAREFVTLVYKITENFPSKEKFGLIDQIRRAAISIVLNIAEGSAGRSDAEFKRFLKMAQGSLHEVIAGFYISSDRKFVNKNEFDQVYDFSQKLNARLNALIKKL